jgi:hypothetical protein
MPLAPVSAVREVYDIAALIGHERGFTLETYSGGKGLRALREIMQRVRYPGLPDTGTNGGCLSAV